MIIASCGAKFWANPFAFRTPTLPVMHQVSARYEEPRWLARLICLLRHYRVLNADLPENVRRINPLLEFRKAVGSFPERPPYGAHLFRSDGLAAFEYAWRKHAESGNRKLYCRAREAYDLIKSGNFLDEETCSRVVNSALNAAGQDASSAVD